MDLGIPSIVPIPLDTIRRTFRELGQLVNRDLLTQVGDAARLGERKRECLNFLHLVRQHTQNIPSEEFNIMCTSIQYMTECLDAATQQSNDEPDTTIFPPSLVVRTGRPGRPRIEINPAWLETALDIRGGTTSLGSIFQCAPRTVRRRALELGLVEPGPPVYVDYIAPDGSTTRVYRSSTRAASDVSDQELDEIMASILRVFPSLGRRMIDGHLRYLGHYIPRPRLQASYSRVHGAPSTGFGQRRIQRRVYNVAGPNSLWHHDGQHGLIRWKIVFHCFIDGYSRLITGIRASNNNRAQTVVEIFEAAIAVHGVPSRVRGDHGTENVLVRQLMDLLRGSERGSYILGRSVHNIRIERLWRDLTLMFGAKWKIFFQGLELHDRLNPDLDAHIWLLHFLFLGPINQDAIEWAEAWNSHVIAQRGRRHASPRDLFFFGMLENGVRGFTVDDGEIEDLDSYGIDWEDYEVPEIQAHHNEGNPLSIYANDNPFVIQTPIHYSHVEVEVPDSPLSTEQLTYLQNQLQSLSFFGSRDMDSYRLLWISALQICESFFV